VGSLGFEPGTNGGVSHNFHFFVFGLTHSFYFSNILKLLEKANTEFALLGEGRAEEILLV
jgi:hypothetical protein